MVLLIKFSVRLVFVVLALDTLTGSVHGIADVLLCQFLGFCLGWGFGLWLYSAPRHRLHDPDGLVLRFEMDPGSATASYGYDSGTAPPASTYTPAWNDPEEAADYEALVAAIEAHGAANAAAAAAAMAAALSSGYAALTLRGAARITDYREFGHGN